SSLIRISMPASYQAESLAQVLLQKAELLSGMRSGTTCARICAGKSDGCAGLIVDRFGALVVATDYAEPRPRGEVHATSLLACLEDFFPGCHLVVKTRGGEAGAFICEQSVPAASGPIVAEERGLRFEIGTDPAHDFGLYLDAAKARLHLRRISAGKRVLNLFCYTAGFGIAAAAGGATEVTNVDPNRQYLAWARRNAVLNGMELRILPDTAQDFLGKHLRRIARTPATPGFDVVVVDPPAFGVGRGNKRLLRKLWPELFASLRAMNPAHVLLLCNDKYFRGKQDFRKLVESELGRTYQFERLGTTLEASEIGAAEPDLSWRPKIEDPFYLEPMVLSGRSKKA
ncbi:MAG TPA: class I SAM-dependent methyltransferase, partial [Polyangia bacterium]